MSILLLGLEDRLVRVLGRRLLAQDDEVRILVMGEGGEEYASMGLHVARGTYLDDADLIERACQNVRTLVTGGAVSPMDQGTAEAVIDGARAAQVSRLIQVGRRVDDRLVARAQEAKLEFVVLIAPKVGPLRRSGSTIEDLAEAIDAADDSSAEMNVVLDLAERGSWELLGLTPR